MRLPFFHLLHYELWWNQSLASDFSSQLAWRTGPNLEIYRGQTFHVHVSHGNSNAK